MNSAYLSEMHVVVGMLLRDHQRNWGQLLIAQVILGPNRKTHQVGVTLMLKTALGW